MTLHLMHPVAHAAAAPDVLDDTGLDALVGLEEWQPGSTDAALEGLIDHPNAPVTAVDAESQAQRVRRTVAQRWSVADDHIQEPASLDALIALVARARVTQRQLRVVGSARSLSRAPEPAPDALLVSLAALGDALTVDATTLRDGVDAGALYRAQAGRVLADTLLDLQARNQALASMGSGCFQTLAGAISTSTHGSGVKYPAFPGIVRSLDVVVSENDGAAKVQRIEPANGPTCPAKFAAAMANAAKPKQLIQDDDTFNAFIVSLGCLGLIYAVTLEVVPAYWLRETRTVAWWSDVRKSLADDLNTVDYYEVLVGPWATPNPTNGTPDHACLVTKRYLVTDPNQQRRNGGRPLTMRLAQTVLGRVGAEIATAWSLRDPLTRLQKTLHTGVTASQVNNPYTDTWDEVLLLNMNINAESAEYGVPLSAPQGGAHQVDPAHAIQATNLILALAEQRRLSMTQRLGAGNPYRDDFDALLAAWRECPAHTSPISLRFTAPDAGHLSMQSKAFTCMIETPMPGSDALDRAMKHPPRNPSRQLQLYAAYCDGRQALFEQLERALGAFVHARPHWGQRNQLDWASTARLFPSAAAWRAVYARYNEHGIFDGPITDQLGISASGVSLAGKR